MNVRWMIRRDIPRVVEIERESFQFPWSEEDFFCTLRQRNCIGMVAEHESTILGFLIYEMQCSHLHLLTLGVAKSHRRNGVGRSLVSKVIGKLPQMNRDYVAAEVRETNLPAQLFFRANGFSAVRILKGFYRDIDEDAYVMERHVESVAR